MFSNNSKDSVSVANAETFIGPSVKLEGNFSGEGDVVVEGMLIGTLNTKGSVRVGGQAIIEAEVRAGNADISGKIKGNITVANHLTLTSTAVIHGDVKATLLTVEEGAVINGKLSMSKEKNGREPISEQVTERQKVAQA